MNNKRPARPILLVSNTRTGSTAFGTALARSNPGIVFVGEAFHPNGVDQQTSFPNWIRENQISALRFVTDKIEICQEYLRSQLVGNGTKAVVFGVKYHDLFNFMPLPSLYDFPPDLFTALRLLGGSIIHLVRRSKFDSTVSSLVAQRRQLFHVRVGEELPRAEEKFNIPVSKLVQQVRKRVVQEMIVDKQIENSKCQHAVVVYEDIFADDSSERISHLSALFGIDLKLNNIQHRKIGINYPSVIANLQELTEAARRWENRDWPIKEI